MSSPRFCAFSCLVLPRIGNEVLLQLKTPGYLRPEFIGKLTLIGGSWSTPKDANPRATLSREILEEIRPEALARQLVKNLRYVGTFDVQIPSSRTDLQPQIYRNFVFSSVWVPQSMHASPELIEGIAYLVDLRALQPEQFGWGHQHIVAALLPELGWPAGSGLGVGWEQSDNEPCEPLTWSEQPLELLDYNPLRLGEISDLDIVRN